MRLHIAYSDRHFHPDAANPRAEWFSCSQIAQHTHRAFRDQGWELSYGDLVPDTPLDLLWTNRIAPRKKNVLRQVYFASVAHYAMVRDAVRKASSIQRGREGHGFYPSSTLRAYYRNLHESDRIVAIGNPRILETFHTYSPSLQQRFQLMDCGVDYTHYNAADNTLKHPTFVHAVTHFSYRKGSDLVFTAWPEFAARHPECRLLLLGREGDVAIPAEFKSRADVVVGGEFSSGSTEYISQLSDSRWVLLPSLAEGQAGTLLEAMSCGCVPVATPESGITASDYSGLTIPEATKDAVLDALLKASKAWTADKATEVRILVKKRHDWNLFRQTLVDIAKQVLQNIEPCETGLQARIRSDCEFVLYFFRSAMSRI